MTIQAPQSVKLVYRFAEGNASMADLLGGKGSNLCEMARLGLPVPPGFVISTQVCRAYLTKDLTLPAGLERSIKHNMRHREHSISRNFRPTPHPLPPPARCPRTSTPLARALPARLQWAR